MTKLKWLPALLVALAATNAHAHTTLINNQLHVDGQRFFIRGMVYSPEPRGWTTENRADGGTPFQIAGKPYVWLCSGTHAQSLDSNSWSSSCYDDDLTGKLKSSADGVNDRYNQALEKRWKLDLDDMQKMGVNTLRLYNINNHLKTHTAFLDELNHRHMKVIYPVLTDYASKQNLNTVRTIVTDIVKETCNKPAVIAYTVGNEFDVDILENPNGPRAQAVKTAAQIVHGLCPGPLTTYAAVDNPAAWALNAHGESRLMTALGPANIDIITINAGYRGDASQPGPRGAWDRLFDDAQKLTARYNKPFLIGEVGAHDDEDSRYGRQWYNHVWSLILKRSDAASNLGAVYFEYNDEPMKKSVSETASTPPGKRSHDKYMGVTTAAWPRSGSDPLDFHVSADLPNIPKTANYKGIPAFQDGNRQIVFYDNTSVGAGRYEMFVNDEKGIGACSYKASPSPHQINPQCAAAAR
ncbi:MAG TPA: hypothetical protein VJS30_12240 [Paraburkholderia sp.]|nr:hypothetical protein [Paraburkholderia sp.]